MNTRFRWFFVIVALQALFLLGWAGWHEYIRQQAPVILLKTRPVDPQDLLRGDYMILGYEIGDVKTPPGISPSDACWVVLVPEGEFYRALSASADKPHIADGQIAVRARKGSSEVLFGIENYYVPERMGTPNFKSLVVEASVSPTGQLYIRRLLLDGYEYP
jgi:uncharacterized membrane-anchored protein